MGICSVVEMGAFVAAPGPWALCMPSCKVTDLELFLTLQSISVSKCNQGLQKCITLIVIYWHVSTESSIFLREEVHYDICVYG